MKTECYSRRRPPRFIRRTRLASLLISLTAASVLLPCIMPTAKVAAAAAPNVTRTQANVPIELTFTAQRAHGDPFNGLTLDVVFIGPDGATLRVPSFWAGGATWKVRFASPVVGIHRWITECNDPADAGLHGVSGRVEIARYRGKHPLYKHGPVRIAADRRHLEHADGTPFFWLGDTWWMGLCHRLHWPDEFKQLAADRKAKGFNVVQIVAGLYPDMPPFDPRGANEAGFPWETNYARIRPEYFDAADQRLGHLVEQGFVPCIVGAWGYFLPWMGVEKAKQHWRYLIARYGAWPVVWCVAGEANLRWYLDKGFPYAEKSQVAGWTDVMRYVRATDPFHRLVTTHPTGLDPLNSRHAVTDESLLDFDMLQTPHGQREAVGPTVEAMTNAFLSRPAMPVVNGEPCYEMLNDKIPAEWPRAMFWLCMMNGAAGHTYGANGIWQCNRRDLPHGASPTGHSYGRISWDEAMRLAGSRQVALGKKFLEQYPWHRCEPMPDSVAWADARRPVAWGGWVWYPEGEPKRDAPVAARLFRRAFDLPAGAKVRQAVLNVGADDKFTASVNGREVGTGSGWKSPWRFEVASLLKPGLNVLAVRAENLPGGAKQNPAGLIASLQIEFADGSVTNIPSDGSWLAATEEANQWREAGFDDSGWRAAAVLAKAGEGPWGRLGGDDAHFAPYALGIADRLRIFYALDSRPVRVGGLRADAQYRFHSFDPVTGVSTRPISRIVGGDGIIECPAPAYGHDWVGVLELQSVRRR